ncbi:DUF4097 family beta strand repeat-containing protein [Amycolatopsis anabasis]|uniref:DUF4097 family beta strand repeat-containing protein n=1 Tax=Amycolatopsis anabasis TaxID=1840409 RepID=UPI00131ECE27|nr:DUF4097 family beta strand repeat-containing protein [Amycolatopsis anabasis]
MARPALAIGGIALIGVGVVMALGWWWPSSATAEGQVDQQIRAVRLESDSGNVAIRVADVRSATVKQTFDYRWTKPGDSYRIEGDQLVLADCGWNCSVDYDVVVPRGVRVLGKADSGDISIEGADSVDVRADSGAIKVREIAGEVKAKADSGDIELSGVGQDVTVQASSGTVRGDRLRGKVDAEVDSGDIVLSLLVAQNVRAQADSGSIELNVPNDRYLVKGDTDSGSRTIGVPEEPSAAHVLDLSTDSGDVTVKAA